MKNEIVDNTKAEILENLQNELETIETGDKKEIYFHDVVTQSVDSNTPQDRMTGIELIDYTGNEQYADMGIIDTSSLDRYITTMAYECLHQEVFNDDFFQYLQDELNNETINHKKAQEIIKKIAEERKKYGEIEHTDNENQIYISTDFDIKAGDFKQPYFTEEQIVDMSNNSIKIFTYNAKDFKDMNRNAIFLENTDKQPFRVYLMQKDKDVDIRDFFKYNPTIKDMDYNLNPKLYVDGQIKKHFKDKKELIFFLNRMANELLKRE